MQRYVGCICSNVDYFINVREAAHFVTSTVNVIFSDLKMYFNFKIKVK